MTNVNENIFFICSHDKDGGIYTFKLCPDGSLVKLFFTPCDRPSYIIISGDMLYATLREPLPMMSGVVKFKINSDFSLTQVGDTEYTFGGVAAHICVHRNGVYCANYLGGTTIKLPNKIVAHTGKGVNPVRQPSAHPHQVVASPDGEYIIVNDLGTDKVRIFDLDLENEVSFAKVPDGFGPRHGIFSEDGKYYYCVGEMGSNLNIFSYSDGKMSYIRTVSVIPEDFTGETTASAIRMFNGRIYVSNRGHDSVCVLEGNGEDISVKGYIDVCGQSPREINFVGDFLVCGNENTDDITIFKMKDDGSAEYIGKEHIIKPWGITEAL